VVTPAQSAQNLIKGSPMNALNITLVLLLALLSIAAGTAKVMEIPQEMAFLLTVGLNADQILAFGVVQILGGVLMVLFKARFIGSIIAAVAFLLTSVFLFMSEYMLFAAVSLIPLALTCRVIYQAKKRPRKRTRDIGE